MSCFGQFTITIDFVLHTNTLQCFHLNLFHADSSASSGATQIERPPTSVLTTLPQSATSTPASLSSAPATSSTAPIQTLLNLAPAPAAGGGEPGRIVLPKTNFIPLSIKVPLTRCDAVVNPKQQPINQVRFIVCVFTSYSILCCFSFLS